MLWLRRSVAHWLLLSLTVHAASLIPHDASANTTTLATAVGNAAGMSSRRAAHRRAVQARPSANALCAASSKKRHTHYFPPSQANPGTAPYFSICAVIRDQNIDVREWVYYHHWLGVQAFYLYDHGSRVPIFLDLDDWIRSGIVHYNFFGHTSPNGTQGIFAKSAQGRTYADCLQRARSGNQRWLAFIDVDEFLVKAEGERSNITSMLREYEPYGGLVVNWRVFSSSQHKVRPQASTLEAYTKCIPDSARNNHNQHVKAIVNVPHVRATGPNPHNFEYKPGFFSVNEMFQRRDGPFSQPVSVSRLALHHYVVKSKEEYLQKNLRGPSDGGRSKGDEFWASIERESTGTCLQGVAVGKACCSRSQ